jgi:hypothetical protein
MLDVMASWNHWMEHFGFATCVDLVHHACLHDAVSVQSQVYMHCTFLQNALYTYET